MEEWIGWVLVIVSFTASVICYAVWVRNCELNCKIKGIEEDWRCCKKLLAKEVDRSCDKAVEARTAQEKLEREQSDSIKRHAEDQAKIKQLENALNRWEREYAVIDRDCLEWSRQVKEMNEWAVKVLAAIKEMPTADRKPSDDV